MDKLTIGIKDIDWIIFIPLSDSDVTNLCLVNKEMSRICLDQEFWKQRIDYFSDIFFINGKPAYMNWKSYYAYLINHPIYINLVDEEAFKHSHINLPIFNIDTDYPRDVRIGDILGIKKNIKDNFERWYVIVNIDDRSKVIHAEIINFIEEIDGSILIEFPKIKEFNVLGLNYFIPFIKKAKAKNRDYKKFIVHFNNIEKEV